MVMWMCARGGGGAEEAHGGSPVFPFVTRREFVLHLVSVTELCLVLWRQTSLVRLAPALLMSRSFPALALRMSCQCRCLQLIKGGVHTGRRAGCGESAPRPAVGTAVRAGVGRRGEPHVVVGRLAAGVGACRIRAGTHAAARAPNAVSS